MEFDEHMLDDYDELFDAESDGRDNQNNPAAPPRPHAGDTLPDALNTAVDDLDKLKTTRRRAPRAKLDATRYGSFLKLLSICLMV